MYLQDIKVQTTESP